MISDKMASYNNANYAAAESMSKTRQIVMLYDAIIKNIGQAKEAIIAKEYEKRFNATQKASNIIIGLHSALDFDKGGEISETLRNFYTNIDLRIVKLNQTNDLEECDAIIDELKKMRATWDEIDQKTNASDLEAPQETQTANSEETTAAPAEPKPATPPKADFSA